MAGAAEMAIWMEGESDFPPESFMDLEQNETTKAF